MNPIHRHHVVQFSCGTATEDRAFLGEDDRSCLLLVADGVGGLDYGGEAAELIARVGATAWHESRLDGPLSVASVLKEADGLAFHASECGQSTAVLVLVKDGLVFGASVGDSEAWLITDQNHSALTASQRSRPLLGTGDAEPVPFSRKAPPGGVLLVGSDGLFRRVPAWMACDLCRSKSPVEAGDALGQLARLPDGKFSDDVSIVVYRLPPARGPDAGQDPTPGDDSEMGVSHPAT